MAPLYHLPQIRVVAPAAFDHPTDAGWDVSEGVKAFGDSIPGYRYSATFLTTLRSNLRLSTADSPPPSAISTPLTTAFSPTQPTPSPLFTHMEPSAPAPATTDPAPTHEAPPLPTLTTTIAPADPPEDRIAALKLIADSVAQQRQVSSFGLITHPATVAVLVATAAVLYQFCDLPLLFTTAAGICMAGLVTVRWVTGPYLAFAEEINWAWLSEGGGGGGEAGKKEEVLVLVTRWGEEIIGTVVVRVVKKERRGYVRAWTVGLRYRGKGVGRGLLEEAARVVWGEGGRGMEFEARHANSQRVLPPFFNGTFDRNEVKGRQMLAEVVAEQKREKSSR